MGLLEIGGLLLFLMLLMLSGGVWIAMTLAQQGEAILLDEPTTYLDLEHQIELMKLTALRGPWTRTVMR